MRLRLLPGLCVALVLLGLAGSLGGIDPLSVPSGDEATYVLATQSLWHDHVPAQSLGMRTAWVERPSRLGAIGLAPPADVKPLLHVTSLQALADRIAA